MGSPGDFNGNVTGHFDVNVVSGSPSGNTLTGTVNGNTIAGSWSLSGGNPTGCGEDELQALTEVSAGNKLR
ncbi:MAG: hypothetical protein WB781_22790 [Candidatus Sulfotelmatobacter sp.]